MVRPGFEPGTFCVLDRCDNQLRHRTVSILRGRFVQGTRHLHLHRLLCYHGHLWPLGMSFCLSTETVLSSFKGDKQSWRARLSAELCRCVCTAPSSMPMLGRLVQSPSQTVSRNSTLTNTSSLRAHCMVYMLSRADSHRRARAPARM